MSFVKLIALSLILILCSFCLRGNAQEARFKVSINALQFRIGDTVDIHATYILGNKKLPPATLDVVIENENGNTWNVRWPLVDGIASGKLVTTNCMPSGLYRLWFAVQPRAFRLYGQVAYSSRKKLPWLQAQVTAGNVLYEPYKIQLEPDRSFTIKDWTLYNNMQLKFSSGNEDDVLHIHPESWLDSAYIPAAQSYVAIQVDASDTSIKVGKGLMSPRPLAWSGKGAYNHFDQAALYNHFFSTGRFRDHSEILIDVIDDSTVTSQTDPMVYIVQKLLEQEVVVIPKNGRLWYQDKELPIFYGEMQTDNHLSQVTLADVAIIKLLPYYGCNDSRTYTPVLAIYPLRYPFVQAGIAQNQFSIKGYDTETVALW